MVERYKHVAVCGSISIDRIMGFPGRYQDIIDPDKLDVLSISVLADKFKHTNGGTAANIAYSLILLGESATIVCSIGSDGKQYLARIKKLGIDTSHIHMSKLPTATFTVLSDKHGGQVGAFYLGAMEENAELSLKAFKNTQTLVVISADLPKAMDAHVTECRASGVPYAYDVGQQAILLSKKEMRRGIDGAEMLLVNEYERTKLCETLEIGDTLFPTLSPICITTLGERGSLIEGRNVETPISVPIVTVNKLADSTGAGDAYRAGFLYGYMRGYSLQICGQLGAVAAAYAVEQYGTQKHRFTMKQFHRRYKQAFHTDMPVAGGT